MSIAITPVDLFRIAIFTENEEEIRSLIENKSYNMGADDINTRAEGHSLAYKRLYCGVNTEGATALESLITGSNLELIDTLLSKGADPLFYRTSKRIGHIDPNSEYSQNKRLSRF